MKHVLVLLMVVLFLVPMQLSAETMTFPGGLSFTENGHSFSITGSGQMVSSSYRSASWCLMLNSNYGANWIITKEGGNKFQLNSLWVYNLQGYSYTIRFKGYDGASEKYSKDVSIPTGGYSQVTFSGWTDITKIQGISPDAGSGWNTDDINYTVNNTTPTNISLSSSSVDDGDPSGTTVGTFSTTDLDDNGTHTYTLASGGTDNSSFTIEGSSLKIAFTADYDTKNSYAIKIRSTDSGSLWYEKDFTITVNPAAPSQYIVSDAENSAFNGVYVRDGNYNGYPQYRNGSYYLVNQDCMSQWVLATDYAGNCVTYSSTESATLPPSTGYSAGNGWDGGAGSSLVITNGDVTLPVELSAFTAEIKDGAVLVKWTTQSETDHLGFIIQRAEQGTHRAQSDWRDIASYESDKALQGIGNTSHQREYEYLDPNVISGRQYLYRLASVAVNGAVEHSRAISINYDPQIPTDYALYQAYPNPFNPVTTIRFDLAKSCTVNLFVTDITGKQVRTLMYQMQNAGSHSVTWDGADHQGHRAASGVYFITMKTSQGHVFTRKVLLLK